MRMETPQADGALALTDTRSIFAITNKQTKRPQTVNFISRWKPKNIIIFAVKLFSPIKQAHCHVMR